MVDIFASSFYKIQNSCRSNIVLRDPENVGVAIGVLTLGQYGVYKLRFMLNHVYFR